MKKIIQKYDVSTEADHINMDAQAATRYTSYHTANNKCDM